MSGASPIRMMGPIGPYGGLEKAEFEVNKNLFKISFY